MILEKKWTFFTSCSPLGRVINSLVPHRLGIAWRSVCSFSPPPPAAIKYSYVHSSKPDQLLSCSDFAAVLGMCSGGCKGGFFQPRITSLLCNYITQPLRTCTASASVAARNWPKWCAQVLRAGGVGKREHRSGFFWCGSGLIQGCERWSPHKKNFPLDYRKILILATNRCKTTCSSNGRTKKKKNTKNTR